MTPSAYTPPLPAVNSHTIEDVYRTPDGFWDQPFIYVYDGKNLVNGKTYSGLDVAMDGDGDFILRSIFGFRTILQFPAGGVYGKFNYRTNWGMQCFSNPVIFGAGASAVISPFVQPAGILSALRDPDTWQVVPERRYPSNGQIKFDLYNTYVSGTVSSGSGYIPGPPVLGFMGVKRRATAYCPYDTLYRYHEYPFTYQQNITIHNSITGTMPVPDTTYYLTVTDFDFELQRLLIYPTSANNPTFYLNQFALVIYDQSGVPLMSKPVPWGYLTDNGMGEGGSGVSPNNQTGMVFPTPPLVYRINSIIRIDVYSAWQSANAGLLPFNYEIDLQGVQRLPCV